MHKRAIFHTLSPREKSSVDFTFLEVPIQSLRMTPQDIFQILASQLKNPILATISEREHKNSNGICVLMQKPILPQGRYDKISSLPDIFYLISFRGFKSRFLPSSTSSYKTKEEKRIFLFPRLRRREKSKLYRRQRPEMMRWWWEKEGNDFVRGNRPQGAI